MTRLWRTYSEHLTASLLTAVVCLPVCISGATVSGVIGITSKAGASAKPAPSDVIVFLKPVNAAVLMPAENARARMLQKNKTFSPHILPITIGTVVEFPNADPIFHSAFSNYNGQLFDLGLYPPGTTKQFRFTKPGIVRVFCNIHPTMSAVILVLDSPFFGRLERSGHWSISNVPAGTYQVEVFDERSNATPLDEGQASVEDESTRVEMPAIKLSEEGYVPQQHKNKYGLDYPPQKDEDKYSGVPQ
jgi:plastocyanin